MKHWIEHLSVVSENGKVVHVRYDINKDKTKTELTDLLEAKCSQVDASSNPKLKDYISQDSRVVEKYIKPLIYKTSDLKKPSYSDTSKLTDESRELLNECLEHPDCYAVFWMEKAFSGKEVYKDD